MRETILVVDSSSVRLQEKERVLQQAMHYQTAGVLQVEKALEWVRAGQKPVPDLVLLDVDTAGHAPTIAALRALKTLRGDLPVIVMAPYGDHHGATQAICSGASDCLNKPVPSERLQIALQNVLRMRRIRQYITWLERKAAGHMDIGDMVGESAPFQAALELARKASASESPVAISGGPGTGKTLLARAIHGSGKRAGKPFVIVNCELLPPHLAHGLLFGQENTPHMDGTEFILGKVREADQGTLLLQEIGALTPDLQQRIIDMLREKTITPAGSRTPVPVHVRLIYTTSAPGRHDAGQRAFQQRLADAFPALSLTLPPLKERRGDIALLARHFLLVHATSENKYVSSITDRALTWLENHPWPGNVRQLSSVIWRAVILCEAMRLDVEDLQAVQKIRSIYIADSPLDAAAGKQSVLFDAGGNIRTLKSVQEEAIRYALKATDGCMTRAARALGIGRSTLYRKVSEYSIEDYISRANQTTRPMMKVSSGNRS